MSCVKSSTISRKKFDELKRNWPRKNLNEFQEKLRLEEAMTSESGQQVLAIRTYRVQLNKQNERIEDLKEKIIDAQKRRDEAKRRAIEVRKQK